MKSFQHCVNCDTFTDGNKFCCTRCKDEYHVMNRRMTKQALNVLSVLAERRTWVSMENNMTVVSLSITRNAPLIYTRNETRLTCEAHILPNGERWLKYHTEREGVAA